MLFTTAVNHKTCRKVDRTKDRSVPPSSLESWPGGSPRIDGCHAVLPCRTSKNRQHLEGAKLLVLGCFFFFFRRVGWVIIKPCVQQPSWPYKIEKPVTWSVVKGVNCLFLNVASLLILLTAMEHVPWITMAGKKSTHSSYFHGHCLQPELRDTQMKAKQVIHLP